MKIRVLSDLHLEYKQFTYQAAGEDLVVLAGDTADLSRQGLNRRDTFLRQISVPVLYVFGNHEYYSERGTRERARLIHQERLRKHHHVRVLDPGVETIDGISFVGCTLWTDFENCKDPQKLKEGVEFAISDFSWLKGHDDCGLRWPEMRNWNGDETVWLRHELSKYDKVVAITHFLPSSKSIHDRWSGQLLNGYFSCDREDLFGPHIVAWIHGHTHNACRYTLGKTDVVCNPRGYPRETGDNDFKHDLIIEV